MTTFDPDLHPRGNAGKFVTAQHEESPVTVGSPGPAVTERMIDAMAEVLDWDTNVSDTSPADWNHTQDDFSPLYEDTALLTEISEAAARVIDDGHDLGEDELREKVMTAIAGKCGDEVTVCTRVWEGWSYGTMGPDDFTPLAECDDVLADLADAAIKGHRGEGDNVPAAA